MEQKPNSTQSYIKGTHLVTIFHNDENLYSVVRILSSEASEMLEEKEVVVTGYFPLMHEHETYVFFGKFKEHPRFGKQYMVEQFRKDYPETKQGVVQYLSSDLFKGIGKKTATQIVDILGERAISKILTDRTALDTVPKLKKDVADALYTSLQEHQGLEQVMITLSQYGFGPQLSMKIYQTYKEEALQIILQNPYRLVEDVVGIGFIRADELGLQLGIAGNHPDRIRAGILYILEHDSIQAGHVYITEEQLVTGAKQLLDARNVIEESDVFREINCLQTDKKLFREENRMYSPTLFRAEKGIARHIKRILKQEQFEQAFPQSEFLMSIGRLEERMSIQYAPSQKDAIEKALSSPILILTGGPGTGKTTVIKGIVEVYADLHGVSLDVKDYKKEEVFPVQLVAPTGRAAKRMSEATGLPAMTIHRLLGYNGSGFAHDEDLPIACHLLIVDEVSMVDTWLMFQLMQSIGEGIQVIFVGDEDQLPSVGPGQVLKDVLDAKIIPTVQLTSIYRQADGSSIIELAHAIKNGKIPDDIRKQKEDRSFISCNASQIIDVVTKVSSSAKGKGYRVRDIQILAPMYRGPAGIDALNKSLQQLFNPPSDGKRELIVGDITYRIGDKILQLVNQIEANVFNGDIGEVVSIFFAKENTEKQDLLIVSFDGLEVTYTRQDMLNITHAYCCSIHKSQGSEFPIVILPIVKSYYRMLRRNLIYTAITRSKQFLILCGEEDALQFSVSQSDNSRQTTLAIRLGKKKDNQFTEGTIPDEDAMIGMRNVTPYDFMVVE